MEGESGAGRSLSRGEALRRRLGEPGASVGLWAAVPSIVTAQAAAMAGADYVVVDEQHGAVGPAEVVAMLAAIEMSGAAPLVRVGRNEPWVIGRALDLGAHGVIVPLVNDAAEAAAAVAACRYAPVGVRSWGVVRGEPDPAPLCLVMVETRSALDNLDSIARTPGLDGLYVGPSDLALGLGLRPTGVIEHPAVLEAISVVREACRRERRIAGVHCLTADDAARFVREGLDIVTAGSDAVHLRRALADAVATARSERRSRQAPS
jgi:4-hydroxy-2-oxoheptanedioate aldolase